LRSTIWFYIVVLHCGSSWYLMMAVDSETIDCAIFGNGSL